MGTTLAMIAKSRNPTYKNTSLYCIGQRREAPIINFNTASILYPKLRKERKRKNLKSELYHSYTTFEDSSRV